MNLLLNSLIRLGVMAKHQCTAWCCPQIGANPEDVDLLHAGQRPILHWKVRMRLDTSGEPNLVNRKAECKVPSTFAHSCLPIPCYVSQCCALVCLPTAEINVATC